MLALTSPPSPRLLSGRSISPFVGSLAFPTVLRTDPAHPLRLTVADPSQVRRLVAAGCPNSIAEMLALELKAEELITGTNSSDSAIDKLLSLKNQVRIDSSTFFSSHLSFIAEINLERLSIEGIRKDATAYFPKGLDGAHDRTLVGGVRQARDQAWNSNSGIGFYKREIPQSIRDAIQELHDRDQKKSFRIDYLGPRGFLRWFLETQLSMKGFPHSPGRDLLLRDIEALTYASVDPDSKHPIRCRLSFNDNTGTQWHQDAGNGTAKSIKTVCAYAGNSTVLAETASEEDGGQTVDSFQYQFRTTELIIEHRPVAGTVSAFRTSGSRAKSVRHKAPDLDKTPRLFYGVSESGEQIDWRDFFNLVRGLISNAYNLALRSKSTEDLFPFFQITRALGVYGINLNLLLLSTTAEESVRRSIRIELAQYDREILRYQIKLWVECGSFRGYYCGDNSTRSSREAISPPPDYYPQVLKNLVWDFVLFSVLIIFPSLCPCQLS